MIILKDLVSFRNLFSKYNMLFIDNIDYFFEFIAKDGVLIKHGKMKFK